MAVLIEGISVVVRRDAIEAKLAGGWRKFCELVPNHALCTDGQLASVAFTSPVDVERFCKLLKKNGLVFTERGTPLDFAVVGMDVGPTAKTPWLEFMLKNEERKISFCWLFEGKRDKGAGTYMPGLSIDIAVHLGWTYEESLTAHHIFIPPNPQTRLSGWIRRGLTALIRKSK